MPHRTPSLLSTRVLRLTFSFTIFKSGISILLSDSISFGNKSKYGDTCVWVVGVWGVFIDISPNVRWLVVRYVAAQYHAIWTHRVATFPVTFNGFLVVNFWQIYLIPFSGYTSANRNSIGDDYPKFVWSKNYHLSKRRGSTRVSAIITPYNGPQKFFTYLI